MKVNQSAFTRSLNEILNKHNKRSADGTRKIGLETQERRARSLLVGFKTLKKLGYKLQDPTNIRTKHIHVLAKHWEAEGLAASTIQNGLSAFRIFCEWIGKPGMVRTPEEYVKDPKSVKRGYVSKTDKSWSAQQIDVEELAKLADENDPRLGLYIRLALAFGLRRLECLSFRPHMADHGTHLIVDNGTKGGRQRVVPIDTDFQREVLAQAKKFAPSKSSHIGWPRLDKKEALAKFEAGMRTIGVTSRELGITFHGLRHQHINDRLESLGVTPAVRTDEKHSPSSVQEKDEIREIYRKVSEEVGHSRPEIIAGYAGSIIKTKVKK